MEQKFWNETDTKFLIDNLDKMPRKEIAKQLDRTYDQLNSKVQRLKKKSPHLLGLSQAPKNRGEIEVANPNYINSKDIEKLTYKLGAKYEVKFNSSEKNKHDGIFIGHLLQETKRYITLKCKLGYCECFLKVDLLRGEVQIREVN